MASPPPSSLKLTYFDMAARAEATRVMLRLGGIAFDDTRIARDAFALLKPSLPYGQIPVLEIDGEVLAETQAIQRYVARLTGMYPLNDPLAALMVEELVTTVSDLYETTVVASIREKDPNAKRAMRDAMATTILPTALRQIETRLAQLAAYPYFQATSTTLSLHEIVLSTFVGTLQSGRIEHVPTTITDGYVRINAAHDKVRAAIATGHVPSSSSSLPVVTTAAPPVTRPATLQLTYFDLPARAEFIRLAFHIGSIAFDDERIAFAAFPTLKPSLPFGQLPVLTVDGVVMAQSFALLRYAGILSGLYPVHDPLAAARMDEVIARVEEIYHTFHETFGTTDAAEKRRLREQLLDANAIGKILSTLERRIVAWQKNTSGPFICGETVTVADLAVYHIVDFLKSGDFDYVPVTIADEYATLVAIHGAVLTHPRVVDWYAKAT